MSATAAEPVTGRGGGASWLWRRQLDSYPDTAPRVTYLAITVLATITLYYELYVGSSVSTLILANLHMSFTFFVVTVAFGALIGAVGSLFAGLTDRYGRANMVVFGLLFTAIFVAFLLPAATNKWTYMIESFAIGFVEGICLVATPALIRDFSPQLGRGTAMGFWTSGPVVGSLIVSVVGSTTVPTVVNNTRFWTHEYKICGIAGLVVFVIALVGLRELSPRLRDQLMVTMRDRALIEARAKGLDVESLLHKPFRQLAKADVLISSLAISIFLLIYYSAVVFLVIYMTTVFGFTVKDANGLGNWEWGFNIVAVILIGMLSDRLRVRKPFMVVGGVAAAAMTVVYLEQFGHHPSYYTMAIILAVLSFTLGVAYVPWMASFTETVEARNPALIATGLAIWGLIIRIVVFVSYLIIPLVITSVTPLVDYGTTAQTYQATYKTQIAFATSHANVVAAAQKVPKSVLADAQQVPPSVVATAQSIPPTVTATVHKIPASVLLTAQSFQTQLADAQRLAPELAVLQANPALFAKLATYTNPATIPPALLNQAVAAAGGGTTYAQTLRGLYILSQIQKNAAAIKGVVAAAPALKTVAPYATQLKTIAPYATQLKTINPYSTQLTAMVPYSTELTLMAPYGPQLLALQQAAGPLAFLQAHGAQLTKASAGAPGQWKDWWWVCFGGMIFFLLTIPLLRGRWRPRDAKRDEQEHEAMVATELAKLNA
jgi:MFS family permease